MDLSYDECQWRLVSLLSWVEFGLNWTGELPLSEKSWELSLCLRSHSSPGDRMCLVPCSLLSAYYNRTRLNPRESKT